MNLTRPRALLGPGFCRKRTGKLFLEYWLQLIAVTEMGLSLTTASKPFAARAPGDLCSFASSSPTAIERGTFQYGLISTYFIVSENTGVWW